jgi:hypothetical protein
MANNPISDWPRFRDLVHTAAQSVPVAEQEAALEELAEDLANVEVLVKIVQSYVNDKGLRAFYDLVWDKKEHI